MTSVNQTAAADVPRTPPKGQDGFTRLLLLLPELAVSLVASACFSTALAYHDGMNITGYLVVAGMTELVTLVVLYLFTYLVSNYRLAPLGLVHVIVGIFLLMLLGSSSWLPMLGLPLREASYAGTLAVVMGALLFYLTRLRWTFVALILEILTLAGAVSEIEGMFAVHAAGFAALAILFIMRSSATRITMSSPYVVPAALSDEGAVDRASPAGMALQIAALGAAASLACLVVALALTPSAHRGAGSGGALTESATEAAQDEPTDEAPILEDQPTTQDGQVGEDPQLEGSAGMGEEPQAEVDDESQTESGAAEREESAEGSDAEEAHDDAQRSPGAALALLALLLLPLAAFPVRLWRRSLARRGLEREPLAADCAARIYLAVRSRLEAMGIARDEAMTPLEFLSAHEAELEGLTMPANMGIDEWYTLTEVYEKARYANADPTESELATCWELYDALPTCIRMALGWRRYLTGAFWRM